MANLVKQLMKISTSRKTITNEDFANGYWLTAEGIMLHVSKMDLDHLLAIKRTLLNRSLQQVKQGVDSALVMLGQDNMVMSPMEAIQMQVNIQNEAMEMAAKHPFWGPMEQRLAELGQQLLLGE